MDTISIIVPVYNGERYLPQCLDSILAQTHEHLEILLMNDGSTDGTAGLCDAYGKKDSRIRVFHLKNGGVSTARNAALAHATGEWITFVDADDWAEPEMLAFALEKAQETKSDIIIWSYFKNYLEEEVPLSLIPGGDQIFVKEKDILHLKAIYSMYGEEGIKESVSTGTVWCKLYRKALLEDHKLRFNPGLTRAQDTVFSIHAFEHASRIAYFDRSLYHYRITNSSTCSGTRFLPDSRTPFDLLLEEFETFIRTRNKGRAYEDAFYARTIMVLMWHLKHHHFHPADAEGLFKKRRSIKKLLEDSPYREGLQQIKLNLLPKKERLMVHMFRRGFILSFYGVYRLHERGEARKQRKFD